MSTAWIAAAMYRRSAPIGLVAYLLLNFSPAAAQVEYVKVCEPYGASFYYIPGTDTCLKVSKWTEQKDLPPGIQPPPPPAGCDSCAELDEEIAKLTERFNKLNGKGMPRWQEDIASDIAGLRQLKADCQKVCTAPPTQTQPDYDGPCNYFGEGFYYIPGTDTCLKIGGGPRYEWNRVATGTPTPPPPAGCTTCAELDEEIAKLTERFNKLNGKSMPRWQEDIASDIFKLREAKAACQKVCTAPPRTTGGPHTTATSRRAKRPPAKTTTQRRPPEHATATSRRATPPPPVRQPRQPSAPTLPPPSTAG